MHPDELSNIYALYTSQIKGQGLVGRPKASYLDQIARHLCSDKEIKFGLTQIKTWAMDKPTWKLLVVLKSPPDDDDNDDILLLPDIIF